MPLASSPWRLVRKGAGENIYQFSRSRSLARALQANEQALSSAPFRSRLVLQAIGLFFTLSSLSRHLVAFYCKNKRPECLRGPPSEIHFLLFQLLAHTFFNPASSPPTKNLSPFPAGSSALAQPLGRPPLPPGVIPPPDYEPSPEELAAAEEVRGRFCFLSV